MTRSFAFTITGGALGLLSALVLVMATGMPAPVQAQQRINPFAAQLLAEHNYERAAKGAAPLRWNAQLARDAKEWADYLARNERFEHASYEARKKAGENLWMGSAGYFSASEMIGGFLAEKRDFLPGTFPEVSRTGHWKDVAHYTQIIWRDTREVGCAVSRSRVNDVLVCRYFPMGNVIGQRID